MKACNEDPRWDVERPRVGTCCLLERGAFPLGKSWWRVRSQCSIWQVFWDQAAFGSFPSVILSLFSFEGWLSLGENCASPSPRAAHLLHWAHQAAGWHKQVEEWHSRISRMNFVSHGGYTLAVTSRGHCADAQAPVQTYSKLAEFGTALALELKAWASSTYLLPVPLGCLEEKQTFPAIIMTTEWVSLL